MSEIRCSCNRRTYMRRVKVHRRHGVILNCRSCGNVIELRDGQFVRSLVCQLIMQTGVGKYGVVIKPHQSEMFQSPTES